VRVFTGIVEEVGKVVSAQSGKVKITAGNVLRGLEKGGSIAVNGVCLTVTGFNTSSFAVDIMGETLRRSNLGMLRVGDEVNLEPPLTLGKPLGGHLVQGHVDGTGKVMSISPSGADTIVNFEATPEVMRYIVPKGFIAVDGISLTIIDCNRSTFQVSVVDFTLKHTVLKNRRVGDLVNLEVDIIAKYIERFSQARRPGITDEFLKEHGFSVG